MDTSAWYEWFAVAEARGASRCYEEWAGGIAEDVGLLSLIDELPESKRQPNLMLAAARFVGIQPGPFDEFREQLIEAWPEVRAIALERRTQTNEPGRCAGLLPLLALLPQPLALLEVGASAGLCLYPDKFSYQYEGYPRVDPPTGPGAAVLSCRTTGQVPIPPCLPEIAWRSGIDLNPLDVNSEEDMGWLETLVWPEQELRRQRLVAAIEVARSDPPELHTGDLVATITEVAECAPSNATLVVFHSAVLAYLSASERAEFTALVKALPGHWISNEGTGVLSFNSGGLPPPADPTKAAFLIAQDEQPFAYAGPHGEWLEWIGPRVREPFGESGLS